MNRFIIDGFNLAFRGHYAFRELMTSTGLLSGCVYGFLNTLKSLRTKYSSFEFVVVWDNHATRKKELFPEYKANRNSFNIDQPIQDLKTALKCLKTVQVEAFGEEADDVIATIIPNTEGLVYIYSSDKDLMQLVEDGKVVLIRPKVGATPERVYDEEAVVKEFGVKPADLACFLAFRGDSCDNVPGVPRLPSKVIASLVKEYHDPIGVYQNLSAEKLTEFQSKSLQSFEKQIILNYDLVKLRTDLDCLYALGSSNTEGFQKILEKYEIKAISASSYVTLFERDTSFQVRTGIPHVKTYNLFEEDA